MKEVWKNIPEYEGYYQASNMGRIRSIDRVVLDRGFPRKFKGRILIPDVLSKQGYLRVRLCVNGKVKSLLVHRLVLAAFYGWKELEGNHKNFITNDNRLINLEYVTSKENTQHYWNAKKQTDC